MHVLWAGPESESFTESVGPWKRTVCENAKIWCVQVHVFNHHYSWRLKKAWINQHLPYFSLLGLPMFSWSLGHMFSGIGPFRNTSWLWLWMKQMWAVTPEMYPSSPLLCSSWPDMAFWSNGIWTWLLTGLLSQVQPKHCDTYLEPWCLAMTFLVPLQVCLNKHYYFF